MSALERPVPTEQRYSSTFSTGASLQLVRLCSRRVWSSPSLGTPPPLPFQIQPANMLIMALCCEQRADPDHPARSADIAARTALVSVQIGRTAQQLSAPHLAVCITTSGAMRRTAAPPRCRRCATSPKRSSSAAVAAPAAAWRGKLGASAASASWPTL